MTETANPSIWKRVRLGNEEMFDFENGIWTGKRPPLVECDVLRNTNFSEAGTLDYSNVAKISIESRMLERKRLVSGDILIERSGGGPTQPVGRVAYFGRKESEFCFSNFTTRLRVRKPDVVDPRFLHLFLLFLYVSGETESLQRRTTGIRNLDFNEYLKVAVPVPPVLEQEAIAHALQTVRKAKETRQGELALERERKAALMEYLFTSGTRGESTQQVEIGEMPQNWKLTTLGDVARITSGGTPDRNRPEYWNGGIPWVKTGEIRYNTIRETEETISTAGLDNSAAKIIPAGTLLMAMYGQGITRGRVAILGIEATLNQACAAILLTSQVMPHFAFFYLQFAYERIRTLGHGANQKNLNSQLVSSIQIPLPSLDEQKEISDTLSTVDARMTAMERECGLLDELFGVMLEELMTERLSALLLAEERQAR